MVLLPKAMLSQLGLDLEDFGKLENGEEIVCVLETIRNVGYLVRQLDEKVCGIGANLPHGDSSEGYTPSVLHSGGS